MTYQNHLLPRKQPAVIPVFFATEMWERFGFYMIQGLLVLYMTSQVFGFSDDKSYAILGAFSAISYITPILGGYLASKILDFEHAIILGGILLAIGYGLLALPNEQLFLFALAIISIGNGFFKPNISSFLGSFYHPDDPQREKGYTIFYVGINVGILLSTASAGYLVRYVGWHAPFLLASIGLLLGTLIFILGVAHLKKASRFDRIQPSIATKGPLSIVLIYLNIITCTLLSYEIIQHARLSNILMLWMGIVIFLSLFTYSFKYKKAARNKLLACLVLILISVVFWAIYFQLFFSMNLFIERDVNRHLFHFVLPTPLFISLESIFIVLLGPYFANLWHRLARKQKNPGIPLKFSLSLFALFIAFAIAYLGTILKGSDGLVDKLYIVIAYFFVTVGELLISPIGLTMITILVPTELVALMMGVWFVALGLGIKLGGVMAELAAIPKHMHLPNQISAIYGHAFLVYAIISLIVAILALAGIPALNRLIKNK